MNEKRLSGKYLNLIKIKEIVEVPDFIFINTKLELKIVNSFLKNSNSKYFILRSAINVEDSNLNSYAGHFFSSEKFEKKDFKKIYDRTYLENQKLIRHYKLNSKVTLILQEFVEHNIGGVLFYPWKFYDNHFLLDLSLNGAKGGVEGRDSQDFLLSLDNKFSGYELINFKNFNLKEEIFSDIKKQLIEIINKIKKIIYYKFDLEWCYSNGEIYVLQIRPITFMPNSLLPENSNIVNKNIRLLNNLDDFVYNDLSESLGFLSFFSYTFLEFLYQNSLDYFHKLGFKAEDINFMTRLTSGQVLVNKKKYEDFFRDSSKFSSFKRGFNSKILHKKIVDFLKNINLGYDVSIKQISDLFSYWQISILCNGIFERDNFNKNITYFDEYELTNFLDIKIENKLLKNVNSNTSWNLLNQILKELFLYKLDKFKLYLKKFKGFGVLDCNFIVDENNLNIKLDVNINDLDCEIKKKYSKDIEDGIYDLTFFYNSNNDDNQRIISKENIEGKVFLISAPNMFKGKIPNDSILVAPYFNNQLISQIDKFKAIILENGGLLSHSAIVAREKKIPYFVNQKGVLKNFKTGDKIKYSYKEKIFKKL